MRDATTTYIHLHSHMCTLCNSMKSGREQHSASGYAPPPSNGTGVDGVRLHSKAGYDDGLRDGGGRNADQYIPRRDRKREVGEIVEDGEISYQVSDVPIAKVGCCVVVIEFDSIE